MGGLQRHKLDATREERKSMKKTGRRMLTFWRLHIVQELIQIMSNDKNDFQVQVLGVRCHLSRHNDIARRVSLLELEQRKKYLFQPMDICGPKSLNSFNGCKEQSG